MKKAISLFFTSLLIIVYVVNQNNLRASTKPVISKVSTQQTNNVVPQGNAPDSKVWNLAQTAYSCARKKGLDDKQILTIIDYTKPSTEKRFWIYDMKNNRLLFNEHVAHAKNTGLLYAQHFSNVPSSKESSLGLFLTQNTYTGSKGYALRLQGLEKKYNDNALARAIVIHGAWYVNHDMIKQTGRIGRSWGCPALNKDLAPKAINTIKNGTLVFSYYSDNDWLSNSSYLHC